MSIALWLVFFYVLGGVTFLPLVLIAVLLYLHWTLPRVPPEDDPVDLYKQLDADHKTQSSSPIHEQRPFSWPVSLSSSSLSEVSQISKSNPASPGLVPAESPPFHARSHSNSLSLEKEHETGVAANFSGVLVVAREYFIYPTGGPNNSGTPPSPESQKASMKKNDSAYSSLYKLLNSSAPKSFVPSKQSPAASSDALDPKPSQKTKLTKYHAVLQHGNLFLYQDPDHEVLKHVIVVAHHLVILWPPNVPDGELFAKRSAICLLKIPYTHGAPSPDYDIAEMLADTSNPPKNAFFLYSDRASEKEDFYFALIRASKRHKLRQVTDNKPVSQFNPVYMAHPLHHKTSDIMDLINTLHSTEANIQTRWLNALLGRLFLSVKDTVPFTSVLRDKIVSKLTRIKRPTYLGEIHVTKLSCGSALPYFTNPRLVDLTPEGKLTIEANVAYAGRFSVQITTKVMLNLGARFKPREVTIALAITLEHLEGRMVFRVKPPPSDRIWYTFFSTPKMSLKIEPVVSTRQIKISMVTNAIENKIRESIKESLVYPNFEDIAFFDTRDEIFRGGIWDSTVRPSSPSTDFGSDESDHDSDVSLAEAVSLDAQPIEPHSTTLRHRKTAPELRRDSSSDGLETPAVVHNLSRTQTRSMDSLVSEHDEDSLGLPAANGSEKTDFGGADDGPQLVPKPVSPASTYPEPALRSQKSAAVLIDTVKKWSGWYSKGRQTSPASIDSQASLSTEAGREKDSKGARSVKTVALEYEQAIEPLGFTKGLQTISTKRDSKEKHSQQDSSLLVAHKANAPTLPTSLSLPQPFKPSQAPAPYSSPDSDADKEQPRTHCGDKVPHQTKKLETVSSKLPALQATSDARHENPSVEFLRMTSTTTAVSSPPISLDTSLGIPAAHKSKRSGSSNSTASSRSTLRAHSLSTGSDSLAAATAFVNDHQAASPSVSISPSLRSVPVPSPPNSLRNGSVMDDEMHLLTISASQRHPAELHVDLPAAEPVSQQGSVSKQDRGPQEDDVSTLDPKQGPATGQSPETDAVSFLGRRFSSRRKAGSTLHPEGGSRLSASILGRNKGLASHVSRDLASDVSRDLASDVSRDLASDVSRDLDPPGFTPEHDNNTRPGLAIEPLTTAQPADPQLLLPAKSKGTDGRRALLKPVDKSKRVDPARE